MATRLTRDERRRHSLGPGVSGGGGDTTTMRLMRGDGELDCARPAGVDILTDNVAGVGGNDGAAGRASNVSYRPERVAGAGGSMSSRRFSDDAGLRSHSAAATPRLAALRQEHASTFTPAHATYPAYPGGPCVRNTQPPTSTSTSTVATPSVSGVLASGVSMAVPSTRGFPRTPWSSTLDPYLPSAPYASLLHAPPAHHAAIPTISDHPHSPAVRATTPPSTVSATSASAASGAYAHLVPTIEPSHPYPTPSALPRSPSNSTSSGRLPRSPNSIRSALPTRPPSIGSPTPGSHKISHAHAPHPARLPNANANASSHNTRSPISHIPGSANPHTPRSTNSHTTRSPRSFLHSLISSPTKRGKLSPPPDDASPHGYEKYEKGDVSVIILNDDPEAAVAAAGHGPAFAWQASVVALAGLGVLAVLLAAGFALFSQAEWKRDVY